VLLVVHCSTGAAVVSVTASATHIHRSFVILQANIDMVKMERDVDVGEEDCINVKMEEVFTPSVCIMKTEHEVSVICWCILWQRFIYMCECMCVVFMYGFFSVHAYHIF